MAETHLPSLHSLGLLADALGSQSGAVQQLPSPYHISAHAQLPTYQTTLRDSQTFPTTTTAWPARPVLPSHPGGFSHHMALHGTPPSNAATPFPAPSNPPTTLRHTPSPCPGGMAAQYAAISASRADPSRHGCLPQQPGAWTRESPAAPRREPTAWGGQWGSAGQVAQSGFAVAAGPYQAACDEAGWPRPYLCEVSHPAYACLNETALPTPPRDPTHDFPDTAAVHSLLPTYRTGSADTLNTATGTGHAYASSSTSSLSSRNSDATLPGEDHDGDAEVATTQSSPRAPPSPSATSAGFNSPATVAEADPTAHTYGHLGHQHQYTCSWPPPSLSAPSDSPMPPSPASPCSLPAGAGYDSNSGDFPLHAYVPARRAGRKSRFRPEWRLGCTWPGCGQNFPTPAHLKRHLRMHTGTKPFGCPVCGVWFSRKDNAKVHIRAHYGGDKSVAPMVEPQIRQWGAPV